MNTFFNVVLENSFFVPLEFFLFFWEFFVYAFEQDIYVKTLSELWIFRSVQPILEFLEVLHELHDDLKLSVSLLFTLGEIVEVFEWRSVLVRVRSNEVFASARDFDEQTVNRHENLTVLWGLLQSIGCVLFIVSRQLSFLCLKVFEQLLLHSNLVVLGHLGSCLLFRVCFHLIA